LVADPKPKDIYSHKILSAIGLSPKGHLHGSQFPDFLFFSNFSENHPLGCLLLWTDSSWVVGHLITFAQPQRILFPSFETFVKPISQKQS
jgi:hypothetical protein